MTTVNRNVGSDVVLDLRFYGPPAAGGALGSPFNLTGWTIRLVEMSEQIQGKQVVTVSDQVNGIARVSIEGTSVLRAGTQTFRVQIIRASGPTTSQQDEGFSVGFPITRIVIGDFDTEDFDGDPPYQQLSGKGGVQLTIAPAEPDIIYGTAPVGDEITNGGDVVTNNGDPVTIAA